MRRKTCPSISGRVGLAAGGGADVAVLVGLADLVDDHRDVLADLGRELCGADPLGHFHQPRVALFLDFLGHRIGQSIGAAPATFSKRKHADAVELGFIQPVEQVLEFVFGLAGEADNEGRPEGDLGAISRQASRSSTLASFGGAGHAFEHIGLGVLEGNVEIGQ